MEGKPLSDTFLNSGLREEEEEGKKVIYPHHPSKERKPLSLPPLSSTTNAVDQEER